MKLKLFLLFLLVAFKINSQQGVETLQGKLDNLLSDPFFNSTLAAVDIYDLTDQKSLYQLNNKMLLHPASNMKILTSAAALLFLGPDYQFRTELSYKGKKVRETFYGDIYITGGCDPDFTSDDLDTLVYKISLLGIKEITGNIIGDVTMIDSLFWGSGWMWDDDPSTDAPYLTALNINDNAIIVIADGVSTGEPVQLTYIPSTEYVTVDNSASTVEISDSDSLIIDRDWINRSNKIIAKGKLRKGVEEVVKINIFKPELYFLTLFKEKLNEAGIRVSGSIKISEVPDDKTYLYAFNRSIDTVLINLNKTSDNLSAEMALRALAVKYYGKPGSSENGIKLIDSLIMLAGLVPSDYKFADGSGVSRYNLASPELILAVLKFIYYQHPDIYKKLYNSFPVSAVDGTLEKRMKNTPAGNKVHAKTGTLSGVSCLSGYLTAANGNMIVFSIMIQNHVKNISAAMGFQNQICNILVEYK